MQRLPAGPRAIADACSAATEAAFAQDGALFAATTDRLAALDPEQVGLVLGAVVGSLLEEQLPDGLTGEDLRDVLERCLTAAAGWFPAVEIDALVLVLMNALGIRPGLGDDVEPSDLPHLTVVRHASLLIAALLADSTEADASAGRRLDSHLVAAFAEIEREQTVELP